jgi:diguanylate cyclase (GGDEF)-like protein/PAS domain S-box-containing protein
MNGRPWVPWLRKHGYALHLAACFLAVTLASVAESLFKQNGNEENLIWVANGLLLTYLLLTPRRRWPAYALAGFAALVTGSTLLREPWQTGLLFNALNLVEVMTAAFLLKRRSTQLPRFTERSYLLRFLGFGVLAGPLAAGSILALISATWFHTAPWPALLGWLVPDGLGIAVVTPACAAIFQTRFRNTQDWRRHWIYLALLVLVTFAGFSQVRVPLMFLIYPLLILVLVRVGLGWAALATLFVAATGAWFTLHGSGPLILARSIRPDAPSLTLQIFIAAGMFMIYTVSVVLESQHATERRLQKIVAQHALVTENSRDVIILADFEGNRSFVSAAALHLAGWTPQEVMKQTSSELVHPDDMPKAAAVVRQLRSGAEDAMIECRIRKRNGEYIWVEASLRVVRDSATGAPSGILNMVRDVTERKQAEQKLQEAYRAVETLAITDALTGLANRRRFDQCLNNEWRRGFRECQPLAMLLIDVDLFKSYNDTYGHVRGDSCLKQIAEAALDVVTRPGDLVSRFGGEEFAVILPNTGSEGAMIVANRICEGLRRRKLAHSANPLGFLTISVGCAALVPSLGLHSISLIKLADEALYKAKRGGRNQVCSCNAIGATGGGFPAIALSEVSTAKTA